MTEESTLQESASKDGQLCSGVLTTSDLMFMVMAAAAPMAVVVALMPMAFAFGNGVGVPAVYLGAAIAILFFAAGYVRIIPYVRNAGAFYAYISASFGRTCGLAAAYVAAISYFLLCASTVGALAFFEGELFERATGMAVRWEVWAALAIALIAYLSYRRITVAAKVLSVALVAEVALLSALDFAIVHSQGLGMFTLKPFTPSIVFGPGLGIAAIYGFNGLIGVEGTAIYQEEARDRERTVPRATYLSVAAIGSFYVITGWCLVVGVGAQNDISAIARNDPGRFIVGQITHYLGTSAAFVLSFLVVTSAFASALALFNNAARYLYALARDGVLPRLLARTHPRHQSPHVACALLSLVLVAVFVEAAIARLDPLLNVSTALAGVGSVGLMALLATTALGIPVFFIRRRIWDIRVTLAPAVGGLMIAVATLLAVQNYSAITGVTSKTINNLPAGLVVIALIGVCQALWLLKNRPSTFNGIGSNRVDQ
jgi:amino acid transporter